MSAPEGVERRWQSQRHPVVVETLSERAAHLASLGTELTFEGGSPDDQGEVIHLLAWMFEREDRPILMRFDDTEQELYFRRAWEAVQTVRPVHYSLFTFGESNLPYYLVCGAKQPGGVVSITQGEVRITRPMIITPDTVRPEFRNFFDNLRDEGIVDFLLARSAAFSHLRLHNETGPARIVSDSVEEVVARLNRQLDDEEEDRVAILTAPPDFAGMAVVKYAAERVWASAPDNINELRERGFL